jgi:predicted amidophosphoribosyltransferase
MNGNLLLRDCLEGLIVIALGGMTWSAIGKLRRHEIALVRCAGCGRPLSRSYEHCPRCKQ